MPDSFSTSPIDPTQSSAKIAKQEQTEGKKIALYQELSSQAMTQYANEAAFNPVMMSRRFETLEEKMRKKELAKEEAEKNEQKIEEIEKITSLSELFEERNSELSARSLQQLLAQSKHAKTKEELLRFVMNTYPDHALADEALEFLEKALVGKEREKAIQAKEDLNASYGREVRAGRNIAQEAKIFSQQGLGSPTGLRDLYRDVTGNPRQASILFSELNQKFVYEKMETVISFLLHSMGSDLKAKGPSIAPGELHTLMTETRNLLAVLWVYRFFKGRMDLINAAFQRAGMLLPDYISFEMLAKIFVQFLLERYPSMDKVLQLALKLGISSSVVAQLILFTQMRDAVRGVALKLFRSEQHRHDILMSFIEALEELDEKSEEEEEEEEKEEDN